MISEAAGPGHIPARSPETPGPCGPPDRFLAARLAWCEPFADRVAAFGDAWGPVLGAEPFMVAWFLLRGLARVGRNRAHRCADVR